MSSWKKTPSIIITFKLLNMYKYYISWCILSQQKAVTFLSQTNIQNRWFLMYTFLHIGTSLSDIASRKYQMWKHYMKLVFLVIHTYSTFTSFLLQFSHLWISLNQKISYLSHSTVDPSSIEANFFHGILCNFPLPPATAQEF